MHVDSSASAYNRCRCAGCRLPARAPRALVTLWVARRTIARERREQSARHSLTPGRIVLGPGGCWRAVAPGALPGVHPGKLRAEKKDLSRVVKPEQQHDE